MPDWRTDRESMWSWEPIALNGPILTIRKFPEPMTMERLMEYGSISERGSGSLRRHLLLRATTFSSAVGPEGKNNFLECTLRVYPIRRARDHDRRRGGTAVKPYREPGKVRDEDANAEGAGGHRDRRADPGGAPHETGHDNRRGTRKEALDLFRVSIRVMTADFPAVMRTV